MKKIVLIASVFIVGFSNAKSLDKVKKTSKTSVELKTKKTDSQTTKNKSKVSELGTYYYFSSCGVNVVTYQAENWSPQAKSNWYKAIEANYCSAGHPYSNTSGLE
ncbi:hypothetical protein [Chryseobacterium aquaticum]|uniref:hypothetical protein n=1 Tax=Chryseobacterium aquaticum TaxID=452084 RepID=UPI003F6EC3D8